MKTKRHYYEMSWMTLDVIKKGLRKNWILTIIILLMVIGLIISEIILTSKESASLNLVQNFLESTKTVNGTDAINGTDGLNGTKGIHGKDGRDGTDGRDGINGTDGTDGLNGINGINGTNGINGLNGINGRDGINGTNGINGINGTNGIHGKDGLNGINGTNGINGKDGRDGINGTNDESYLMQLVFDNNDTLIGQFFGYVTRTVIGGSFIVQLYGSNLMTVLSTGCNISKLPVIFFTLPNCQGMSYAQSENDIPLDFLYAGGVYPVRYFQTPSITQEYSTLTIPSIMPKSALSLTLSCFSTGNITLRSSHNSTILMLTEISNPIQDLHLTPPCHVQ